MDDEDKSGFISASELKSVISDYGVNLKFGDADQERKIVDQIMNSVDKNKDGKISFEEFTDFMN